MMRFQWMLIAGLILATALAGCKKASNEQGQKAAAPPQPAPAPVTVARFHWIGSKALGADTNSGAAFKKVLALPETAKLAAQTLDKLALGLVRGYPDLPATNRITLVTNYPTLLATNKLAGLLRPLLQDLLENESVVEVRHITNQPGEVVIAARLDESHAALWATNLASLAETLNGSKSAMAGSNQSNWALVLTNAPWKRGPGTQRIELFRSGEWTLLGLSEGPSQQLKEFAGKLKGGLASESAPLSNSNQWFETKLDLPGLSSALGFGWKIPVDFPKMWLAISEQGENVLTQGKLTFAKPLPAELPPWNIPTNQIHDPLHTFVAARGFGPWLAGLPTWKELQVGDPPNQFIAWCQSGTPFLDYFAAPMANASNVIDRLGERLFPAVNPLLSTNRMGVLERATNFHGLVWNRVPLMAPFIKADPTEAGLLLSAGLSAPSTTNTPPPEKTLADLLNQTNAVYFETEITGPRIEAGMYLSQLFRIVTRHPQISGDSGSYNFLKAIMPVTGPTRTLLARENDHELSLVRTSTLGFNSAELHLLSDWLESPIFPLGLHTTLTKMAPFPPKNPGPGSVPGPK